LEKCRLVTSKDGGAVGLEDVLVYYKKNVAFFSSDDRTDFIRTHDSLQGVRAKGFIYMYDFATTSFEPLPVRNYNDPHFHPHGLGLWTNSDPAKLFVVNHGKSDAVSIFDIVEENGRPVALSLAETLTNPLFTGINDIVPVGPSSFYVSNMLHYHPKREQFMNFIEGFTAAPWSDVVFCEKELTWGCSIALGSLRMPNGLETTTDLKTVFVAELGQNEVLVTERARDNSLVVRRRIPTPNTRCDNLFLNDRGQLLTACHPKGLTFVQHMMNVSNRAPTQVLVLPTTDATAFTDVLITNGEILAAATGAASYGNKLLVGSVMDPGFLLCENLLA